jgi:hypothetical protein
MQKSYDVILYEQRLCLIMNVLGSAFTQIRFGEISIKDDGQNSMRSTMANCQIFLGDNKITREETCRGAIEAIDSCMCAGILEITNKQLPKLRLSAFRACVSGLIFTAESLVDVEIGLAYNMRNSMYISNTSPSLLRGAANLIGSGYELLFNAEVAQEKLKTAIADAKLRNRYDLVSQYVVELSEVNCVLYE